VDVLEASVEQYAVIWVNGEKFEFSAEAMRRARAMQRAWSELCMLLERWSQAAEQPRLSAQPTRSELRNALVTLDFMWASFEHKYIAELIGIEEKARRLIVQAIEHDRCLQLIESQRPEGQRLLEDAPGYREEQRRLALSVAHLNSVANFRRKGRDDLGADVLADALAALRRCDAAADAGESTELLRAARILATDVVEAFEAVRQYLREVERCLERVDPHLCNNAGLVARLVDWEESWELGARYVQRGRLLDAVCDLVAEIRAAQLLVPALATMCEECDVEFFLVLPRIIWLRFLAEPAHLGELLKSLLPHRFAEPKDAAAEVRLPVWDAELEAFVQKFHCARQQLVAAQTAGASGQMQAEAQRRALEVLTRRVVRGAAEGEAGGVEPAAAVEGLMHELESWSIELQRHCPEDWNQCSAILVRCLTGGAHRQKQAAFRV